MKAMTGSGTLHLTFPSSPLSVRRALQTVVTDLQGFDLEERGTVELVLAEALNNVAEHAYGAEDRGWISLDCTKERDGLHFRIRDEGRPMPDGVAPMGDPAPLPEALEAMPEGGFGWFLIRDLSRDVCYSRQGDVNELTFRMRIGGAEPGL
ncbi:ATP-binding protein [Ferrimonas balearica]|nr:ATP-binding protein [Ferrimonas balearica]